MSETIVVTRDHELDQREVNTLLAALRLFQKTGEIVWNADDCTPEELEFLYDKEIDWLCETINSGGLIVREP